MSLSYFAPSALNNSCVCLSVCVCEWERRRFGVNDRLWYPIAVDGCSAAPVAVVACGCDFSLERGRLPRRCGLRQGWMIENITPINNALIGNQWEYTRQKIQTRLQWGARNRLRRTYKSQLEQRRVKWFKVIACLVELCTHTLSDVLLQQVEGSMTGTTCMFETPQNPVSQQQQQPVYIDLLVIWLALSLSWFWCQGVSEWRWRLHALYCPLRSFSIILVI